MKFILKKIGDKKYSSNFGFRAQKQEKLLYLKFKKL